MGPLPGVAISGLRRNGIRGLFQGMPGPWMRFPFSLSLQGESVEIPGGTPQCGEAGKGRSRWLGRTGEADETQPPLSPVERPLPEASSPPTRCNARCNLASKHRITANQGEKAPKGRINFCFPMQILWPVIEGSEQDQFSSLCKFQAEGI